MRTIAFASGKGGVGKTTIALNLGLVLAKAGKRVVLIDADLDMANVSIMLGVELAPITLHNVLAGEHSVNDALYEGPAKLFYVPSALSEEKKELDYEKLKSAVSHLENAYDYILLDCPPSLSEQTRQIISSAREIILVLTPDPASVVDALKVKKFADRIGVKITGVALNKTTLDKTELRAPEIEAATKIKVLANLPEDAEVKRSLLLQKPVVLRASTSPFSKAMYSFAANLSHEKIVVETKKTTFWQNIKNFFKKILGG